MKTMLTLFFLFLTFTAKPLVGAVGAEPDAVLDTDGDELQASSYYYIRSSDNIGGSRLTLPTPNPIDPCPIRIIGKLYVEGLPVAISPVITTESVIRESTYLNFQFSSGPICSSPVSRVWKVESTLTQFVTIDGVEVNPTSWFKIEKSGEGPRTYKLVHCPSVASCSDLDLSDDRYLVLSDQAFQVSFVKANVKSANKRIFSVI